jgi:hypothetical protein
MACALAMCAVGGMGRDVVLRIREVNGPGIRSTLVEASRLAGPKGQFVVLNDANASWVFSYYIKRKVKQRIWWNGQIPTQTGPESSLALVAVASKTSNADTNALFGGFERRLGRPLKVRWSQTAHEVLLDTKDRVAVWLCE